MTDDFTPDLDGKPFSPSGRGSATYYLVEARLAYYEPRTICGHQLDCRWRDIYFSKAPIGVPNAAERSHPDAARHGLYGYETAQALRWWLLATAAMDFQHCIETRLVKVRYHYEWRCEEVGVSEATDSRDEHDLHFRERHCAPSPPPAAAE